MRIIILSIFVLLQSNLFSQKQTLEGFMEIKWGANSSQVIKQMSNKNEVKITSKNDTLITMMGGKFAGRKVFNWQFFFVQNRFYAAAVLLEVSTPLYLETIFEDLRNDLSDKYGKPSLIDSTNSSSQNIYWDFNQNQNDECYIYLTMKSYSSFPFFSVLVAYQNNSILHEKLKFEEMKKKKSLNEL